MREFSLGMFFALAIGCGARTDIDAYGRASTSSMGGGGVPAGGAGGVGGVGGGGATGGRGGDDVCTALEPIADIAGANTALVHSPSLIGSSEQEATLVTAWQFEPNGPSEIRHTSFEPWGAWPADPEALLAPTFLADFDGGIRFAASTSEFGGSAILFFNQLTPPMPSGATLLMTPFQWGEPDLPSTYVVSPEFTSPRSLAQMDGFFAAAYALQGFRGEATFVSVLQEQPGNVDLFGTFELGCAGGEALVAAAPSPPDAFLVAFANSLGLGGQVCDDLPAPATRVHVARVGFDGGGIIVSELDGADGEVVALAAAPAAEGTWMLWVKETSPPKLSFARVDEIGSVVTGPFERTIQGNPRAAGIARMGAHVVVGWDEGVEDTGALLRFEVIDASGGVAGSGSLHLPFAVEGPVTLLGGPDGASFVVSWNEATRAESRARVARFDCDLP